MLSLGLEHFIWEYLRPSPGDSPTKARPNPGCVLGWAWSGSVGLQIFQTNKNMLKLLLFYCYDKHNSIFVHLQSEKLKTHEKSQNLDLVMLDRVW